MNDESKTTPLLNRRHVALGLTFGALTPMPALARGSKTVGKIFVSLADNKNQGIVPIPKQLGNGQSARTNLYWGALFGMKTYFKKRSNWTVTSNPPTSAHIRDAFALTRIDTPSQSFSVEAWDGAQQKKTVEQFYKALLDEDKNLGFVAFIGHNALMDIDIPIGMCDKNSRRPMCKSMGAINNKPIDRKASVLACHSASYFTPFIEKAGVDPYVMTYGLMAPEAYSMEGILNAWLDGQDATTARQRAAAQYAKFQKIPLRNAQRLFGL